MLLKCPSSRAAIMAAFKRTKLNAKEKPETSNLVMRAQRPNLHYAQGLNFMEFVARFTDDLHCILNHHLLNKKHF